MPDSFAFLLYRWIRRNVGPTRVVSLVLLINSPVLVIFPEEDLLSLDNSSIFLWLPVPEIISAERFLLFLKKHKFCEILYLINCSLIQQNFFWTPICKALKEKYLVLTLESHERGIPVNTLFTPGGQDSSVAHHFINIVQ